MRTILQLLILLQAIRTAPLLENEFVEVFRDAAPCAAGAPTCGDRVVVALSPVEVNGKKMQRGDVQVFLAGQRYSPPGTGEYLEVAVKPGHPRGVVPIAGSPPPPHNKVLYDAKDFTVFEENMAVDEYDPPHTHNVRMAIFLNDTQVQQWTDGKSEIRQLKPDVVLFRPPVVHASKDVGKIPIRNILIEFKP
jgi:hypothetical protein